MSTQNSQFLQICNIQPGDSPHAKSYVWLIFYTDESQMVLQRRKWRLCASYVWYMALWFPWFPFYIINQWLTIFNTHDRFPLKYLKTWVKCYEELYREKKIFAHYIVDFFHRCLKAAAHTPLFSGYSWRETFPWIWWSLLVYYRRENTS